MVNSFAILYWHYLWTNTKDKLPFLAHKIELFHISGDYKHLTGQNN